MLFQTMIVLGSHTGLAFSEEERERLYLRGLLPSGVLSQEVQAERAMINIRSKQNDLDKHTYLTSLQVVIYSISRHLHVPHFVLGHALCLYSHVIM